MIFMDPTLYGTTLPQRDIPVPPSFPFLGQNLPFPWQNLPVQGFLPWQYLNKQWFPQAQQWFPQPQQWFPQAQQGLTPFVPQTYGFTPPTMPTPIFPPATHPYMIPGGFPQAPVYGLQRPYPY